MHVETLLKYLHQSYEILTDSEVIEVQNKVYRIIFSEQSIFSPYSMKLIKFVKYQTPLSFIILHFSCLYFFQFFNLFIHPFWKKKGKQRRKNANLLIKLFLSRLERSEKTLNCNARSIWIT